MPPAPAAPQVRSDPADGRRAQQAKAFAKALTTIEEYANMPHRIRRRSSEGRHEISKELDKIQSRIAFQYAWLQIEAPKVAAAYDRLVRGQKRGRGTDEESLDSAAAHLG